MKSHGQLRRGCNKLAETAQNILGSNAKRSVLQLNVDIIERT